MVLTADLKIKLKKLFQEKKFSEVINLIETNTNSADRTTILLNLLGVAKLLKEKPSKENLSSAIKDFKQAYLNEKNTETGLEALTNYINASIELYDLDKSTVILEDIIFLFKKLKNNWLKNYSFNNAMSRVFKRLNNAKETAFHLEKMIESKDVSIGNLCDYIYHKSFNKDWSQSHFLDYGKYLDKKLFNYPLDQILNFPKEDKNKIKIGFFSGDVCHSHSITYFLKTIFSNYDKKKYEIYLILNQDIEDDTTKIFRDFAFETINVIKQDDIEAINQIRSLSLDCIFDLMGITSTNRINLFKNRLAKKQFLWLGYCNTLGIKNMDYLIADPNLVYANEHEMYSEKIIYLPNIWNCHSGFEYERKKTTTPIIKNNYITFGSFNNFNKINDDVVKVWSKILKKVKYSKLILKSSSSIHSNERLIKKFKENNIIDSVEFVSREKNFENHLKIYNNIDLALDTFPYNGVTTSFEAIWMGVPVLTMTGYNFNSRCGESINKNLNIGYLISKNEDEYVEKAIYLSNNVGKLQSIRDFIFDNSLNSPLFNADKFKKSFFRVIDDLIAN